MKKSKKILIISHLYPSPQEPTKGIFVHQQSLALKQAGFEVEVISPRVFLKKGAPQDYEIGKIKIQAPKYLSLGRGFAFLTDLTGYLGVKKALKRTRIKPDLILAHTALPDGGIARIVSQKLGIPYFVYVHGADVQHKINYNTLTRKKIIKILSDAKKVFVNSAKTEGLVKSIGINSKIIPMGVDELKGGSSTGSPSSKSYKVIKSKTNRAGTAVRLVSVCNLEIEKGIQYAIEAVKKINNPNVEYLIIGDGSFQNKLRELAADDKRIKFLGRLGQEEVFTKLATSDIFVLPSYNEAFGVAYLEAMSFGLPIIGVKGEGVEDIVSKGECGILVERESTQAVQKALEKLIQDETSRKKMGEIGQKIVRENYLWDTIAVELKKELEK
jgi:glycosyltransferase involved in cell wall biosynthesis